MPAIAREPSGTLVEVLCGQPEQYQGLRSTVMRGTLASCSLARITSKRALILATMSSGKSMRSKRLAMALAMMAGDNS